MDSNIERWYSMKEICEYLGVSRDTVLAWIDKREMPATKIGRLWKFKINFIQKATYYYAFSFLRNSKIKCI